ncbi:YkvA family protein [Algoriphagus halophytocola]|uniref:YkvA family protein n=1 Tax=Algoriphagus halophytocola TaxID=2991499 RepID=A0ABY6MGI5_9BACT|nr:YkvA family protein [Algoriphagus sp. TR-M5]UZD22090.1 YkvA family protein [Algoriphagus sp. TR-M5]
MSLKDKANETLARAKVLFGKQAENLAEQEEKVKELVAGVKNRLVEAEDNSRVKKLVEPITVFIRMIKAHFNGTHKLSMSTLGLLLLGLVYFVSPIDMIPDFLGVFGFADDLSVILAIYAKLKDEVSDFLDWERTQG